MGLLDGLGGVEQGVTCGSRRRGPRSPARRTRRAPRPWPTAPSRRCGCRDGSPTRRSAPASSFWNASVSGALPCISRTICVPATAHHSWSNSSLMKWFSGCLNRLTSTLTRSGGGLGVGVGDAPGSRVWPGPRASSAGVRGRVVVGDGPRGHEHRVGDRAVRGRVDDQRDPAFDPLGDVVEPRPDAERVRPDGAEPASTRSRGRWRRQWRRRRAATGHGIRSGRLRAAGETRGAATLRRARPAPRATPWGRPPAAARQASRREVDRPAADRHVGAGLVSGDRLLHGSAHRRDLLRRIELDRDDVVVRLQSRERLANLLFALQRRELARRERALARFRGELFDLRGTNSHG